MKDKFQHDAKDFIKALNLDKDALLGYVEPEVKAYIKDNKALSNCVIDTIASIKKDNPKIKKETLDLMLFVTGMLFEQVITTMQSKMSLMGSLFDPLFGSDIKFPLDVKSPLDLIKKLKDLKDIQKNIQENPADNLIESFLNDKNDGVKGPSTEFLESIIGRDKLDEIVKRSLKKAGLDIKDLGKILKDRTSETITQPFNTDDLIKSMQEDDE